MNGFFDRLFGRKEPAPNADQKAVAAKPGPSPAETFQPYQPGDVIAGKYEVRRVLGNGGFGIVYHMRFRETGVRSEVAEHPILNRIIPVVPTETRVTVSCLHLKNSIPKLDNQCTEMSTA